MQIIGIDYSINPAKTGLALGSFDKGRVTVREVRLGSTSNTPVQVVIHWLKESHLALLAIDAPLGWPSDFGPIFSQHEAGELLAFDGEPKDFFSRLTDRVVRRELNKKPLDVGANLIARTAFGALRLLQELRLGASMAIPIAWQQGQIKRTSIIEVYPAGTLAALGINTGNYRGATGSEARTSILHALDLESIDTQGSALAENSPHALDAVICIVAAADLLSGKCIPITNRHKARKEGWIWVRQPVS
jgi:predicted RNase H-like nuclease